MILSIEKASKLYKLSAENQVTAVQDIDLHVERGEFIIITGRSGSGKTTLLNLAAGLIRPTSGKVRLYDADLWSLPDRAQSRLRNEKIGFVFQFPSLLPGLTVLENVTLPHLFSAHKGAGVDRQRALELLAEMGLTDKQKVYPRQLSAGQQQRVVIARALIHQPELLIADEPTSDLDETTEFEIMELFKKIHASTGITILMVTHTSQLVPYGTRSLQMERGRLVNPGSPVLLQPESQPRPATLLNS